MEMTSRHGSMYDTCTLMITCQATPLKVANSMSPAGAACHPGGDRKRPEDCRH